MQPNLTIDKFYVRPPVKYEENIKELSFYRRAEAPAQAEVTDWDISDCYLFDSLVGQLHVLYPKYKVEDLWLAWYRQGDYAEAHNHIGFDWSFVWYLDTCIHCSPLVFPNILKPWLPPEVIKPKVGNLHVFDGSRPHYVPPHTCAHDRIVVSGNLIHRTVQNDLNDDTRSQYSKVF